MVEGLDLQKTRAAEVIAFNDHGVVKRVRLSLCAMGCDQAFKGIWWMPWH
jgi:hypothetical protein